MIIIYVDREKKPALCQQIICDKDSNWRARAKEVNVRYKKIDSFIKNIWNI